MIFFITYGCLVCILAFSIPEDKKNYLYEYNHKIGLMETTPQPRVVIIGGSNVAFGTDSRTISDSLNINVINLGLDAGIGTKFPIEDCLQYIKGGDIAVFQFEYENFYNGGEGDLDNFPSIMNSTGWRSPNLWTTQQWINVILGLPKIAIGNFLRLCNYPFTKSWDVEVGGKGFKYKREGFNEYGDETSHLDYPSLSLEQVIYAIKLRQNERNNTTIDKNHVNWLKDTIKKYEEKGAKVVMLPPVCIKSQLTNSYNEDISISLMEIGYPYMESPSTMALDDSCVFDRGYHVTIDGVKENTKNIIKCLQKIIETN